MNSDQLKAVIREYILKEFLPGERPENVGDDLPLISTGILDSIATLKLVMFLDESCNIALEAHEADKENMDTINMMVATAMTKAR